jgi:hypothetical protein
MLYVPADDPVVFHTQVLDDEKPCTRCHAPPGSWSQNSYAGLEQPAPEAVKVTDVPAATELDDAVSEADVQPVKVTVLPAHASSVEVDSPFWIVQTWTAYAPGARPEVLQAQVGSLLYARSMCQLPSRYWTQYSYCGLGQPLALALKLTVDPAGWVALGGERLALEHGGGVLAASE